MPVASMPGDRDGRLRPDAVQDLPWPIGDTPSSRAASSRSSWPRSSRATRHLVRGQAVDGDQTVIGVQRVDEQLIVASIESGTAPPNMPECEAWSSVRTVRRKLTLPAGATVSAGVVMFQLPESATTMASAASWSRYHRGKFLNEREPNSSALDEDRETEVEVVDRARRSSGADRRDVREDAGLVIRCAQAEQPITWRTVGSNGEGIPVLVLAGRLDVVVRA